MSKDHDFDIALDDLKATWEGMGIVHDDALGPLFPTTIRRRQANGDLDEVPVTLMLANPPIRAQARQRARSWAAKLKLRDRVPVGGELVSEDEDLLRGLEKLEFLALVIREADKPHNVKYGNGEDLLKTFKAPEVLEQTFTEQNQWQSMNDPRYGSLTAEQLWDVIRRVAMENNPLPLASIGGVEQAAFIVRSAREAFKSQNAPWYSPPPSTSPPASASSSSTPTEPPSEDLPPTS